jgi:hypothetical protein
MAQADASLTGGGADWWHETAIDGQPPRAFVRAFVCHHLMAHRLTHLLDIVQVVACELAANAIVHARHPVVLALSKVSDEVRFEVVSADPTAFEPAEADTAREAWYPSRFVELLSMRWGVSSREETRGVWVAFDARADRHARHVARRSTSSTRGRAPDLGGGRGPW